MTNENSNSPNIYPTCSQNDHLVRNAVYSLLITTTHLQKINTNITLETSLERKINHYLYLTRSLIKPLLDRFNSHGGKNPFSGDCINRDDVESCLCLNDIDDRQPNVLLSLLFSLSPSSTWLFGSCCTAVILRASGSTQLKTEPEHTYNKGSYS